jgi:hypothetical protein
MQSHDEIAAGIAVLRGYVRDSGLSLSERRLRDRRSYYFEITGGGKWFDLVLSEEFLMDLPATAGHRVHIEEYLPPVLMRFQNSSPSDFFAKCGTPFTLKIHWPFKEHPARDVIWCHVEVEDLRTPGLIAMTTPVIGMLLDDSEFQFKPLARVEAVVNAIRNALDRSEIQFYGRREHPSETQEIKILDRSRPGRAPQASVEDFTAEKVRWLAFNRGDQFTKVWVADPWDASYLGVSSRDLIRAAQVLRSQGVLALTADSQFASAGDVLLQTSPVAASPRARIGFHAPNQ